MQKEHSDPTVLKERIAAWLVLTRDAEPAVGLAESEAAARARELFRRILDQSVTPESLMLDDEMKQVLSVLVRQLRESTGDPEQHLREADVVYQFIHRLRWPATEFAEERDLLYECAEIGWGAMGLTVAEVIRRRSTAGPIMACWETDPIGTRSMMSAEDASAIARAFVEGERQSEELAESLQAPDVLFAICSLLRSEAEISPAPIAEKAVRLYEALTKSEAPECLFDEREYLRGEAAFIVGSALRYTGKLDEAEHWLERADAAFRHTINPAPLHTNVAFARLALRYARGRHHDVLELLPSVLESFEKLGMRTELARGHFFHAVVLQAVGKPAEALAVLQQLRNDEVVCTDVGLRARVLVHLGDYLGVAGNVEEAMRIYEEALPVVREAGRPVLLAELKWSVGETYRSQGLAERAVEAFRSAREDYAALDMNVHVAHIHLVTAEALVSLNRPREAEWEILAALPTIEEQKMVPEGFAAVALLKESVRRRKTDPNALRELREHLQKQN